MKLNVLSWSAAVAWLCVSTFSQPAECMRWTPQTPDDVKKLSAECEKGQLASCTALGIDYLTGRGVTKDENKARALLERACGGNDARGCNNLGIIYAEGQGVPKDEARAVQLYQRGCDGGYVGACVNLGSMYVLGRGVAKDEALAVQLYERACNDGLADGCGNLANMYVKGAGVAKNEEKAAKLSEKACEAGSAFGCTNLGALYENGQGVAKDIAHAVQLYQRSCDAGDATGCDYLGDMYAVGRGVAKDKSRSAALYQKSCKLGGAHACLKIGEYRTGRLLKIKYDGIIIFSKETDKASYELTIQDGPYQYVAVCRAKLVCEAAGRQRDKSGSVSKKPAGATDLSLSLSLYRPPWPILRLLRLCWRTKLWRKNDEPSVQCRFSRRGRRDHLMFRREPAAGAGAGVPRSRRSRLPHVRAGRQCGCPNGKIECAKAGATASRTNQRGDNEKRQAWRRGAFPRGRGCYRRRLARDC